MTNEVLIKALRGNGYKVTPQRVAVYETLGACRDHPCAETLYKMLQPAHPRMSFATVYKVLEVLIKIGVVRSLDFGEGSTRFDLAAERHHHARCVKCGRVTDVFGLQDKNLLHQARAETGMVLTGEDIVFYGLCRDCQ